jgi:ATP-dependent DNA helicase RecG
MPYEKSVFNFAGEFLIVTFPFDEGYNAAINANNDIDGVDNGVDGVDDDVDGVDDDVDIIINALRDNPHITIKGLAIITGVSVRTIDRKVEKLKAEGLLKRVGSARSGHWEICK